MSTTKPTMIEVRTNEFHTQNGGARKQKQVTMFIGGLRFTSDVHDDRDITLARRLAHDFNISILEYE